ncbi:MAG TPA: hypothetical protein VL574_16205 [Stellaceae bacterium]|jgi:hypothetical protein|nr:hypothetical protein [Stellaceae bacterium]
MIAGYGILAPLILVLGFLVPGLTIATLTPDRGAALAVMFTCVLLATIGNFMLGRHLNSQPDRIEINAKTGQRLAVPAQRHSFLFIKMQYWSAFPALFLLTFGGFILLSAFNN